MASGVRLALTQIHILNQFLLESYIIFHIWDPDESRDPGIMPLTEGKGVY